MEKVFNKLVRDNIPNIIKGHNEVAVTDIYMLLGYPSKFKNE